MELLARLKPDHDYDDTIPNPNRWAKFVAAVAPEFRARPRLGEEFDEAMTTAVWALLNDFVPRMTLGARERLVRKLDALDKEYAT